VASVGRQEGEHGDLFNAEIAEIAENEYLRDL
jgi:hypothetical protein